MSDKPLHLVHLDDDALYLEQFAAALAAGRLEEAWDYRLESVDTPAAYEAIFATAVPDLVVLDVNIGRERRGRDVAAWTKAKSPGTVVVMCSDLKGVGVVSQCISAGADDFIFKNSDDRDLALRLYGTLQLRRAAVPRRSALPKDTVGATMQAVFSRVNRLLGSAVTAVHVRGESGTGKELVADLVAAALPRGTPFVRLNCGAIAPTLLESELFGHMRGAFTGALADRPGLVEQAAGGWLFLDEVATLPPPAQVALLRVLESRMVRRIGATTERPVAVRILSATNEPMDELIAAGRFRADLWQRLREAEVELPPLRERLAELPELIRHFSREMLGGPYEVAPSAVEILSSYDWREGNVRELRNCLRAMTEMAVGKLLTPLSLPKWFWQKADGVTDATSVAESLPSQAEPSAQDCELKLIWSALDAAPTYDHLANLLLLEMLRREAALAGKVSIRQLARVTGIPKSTLATRLRQLVDLKLASLDELGRLVNVTRD